MRKDGHYDRIYKGNDLGFDLNELMRADEEFSKFFEEYKKIEKEGTEKNEENVKLECCK